MKTELYEDNLKAYIALNVKDILKEHILLGGSSISTFLDNLTETTSKEIEINPKLICCLNMLNDELDNVINELVLSTLKKVESVIKNYPISINAG